MKIFKKICALLLCGLTAFSAFACSCNGGGDSSSSSGNSAVEETQRKEIAKIVENRSSDYKVLLAKDAMPAEVTAATELVNYIKQSTGVELETVTDDKAKLATTEKYLSLGGNKLFARSGIENTNLNTDGYVLKTVDNTLFIVGEQQRGTLFGVYDWLERELDVHFLTNTFEYVPTVSTVTLYQTDVVEIPAIANRTFYYDASKGNVKLAAKMRTESYYPDNAVSVGGKFGDIWTNGVHSVNSLIPPATYYPAHDGSQLAPNEDYYNQWFSVGPGATSAQLSWNGCMPCFSNGLNDDGTLDNNTDSYIRKMIEITIERITENPSIRYFMITQPDNQKVCNCAKCVAQIATLENNRTAQLILFINCIAREVRAWMDANGMENRELDIVTNSYQWSTAAPVKVDENGKVTAIIPQVDPRDDVSIVFIPIVGCFIHDIDDKTCETNVTTVGTSFEQWTHICDSFSVFDYCVNYTDYLTWFPCMGVMQKNLKLYVERGVNGLITESTLGSNNYYQQDLLFWLFGKLAWNPNLDMNALISEFNYYYFGAEAGKIADECVAYLNGYFEYVSRTQSSSPLHLGIYTYMCRWLVSEQTLNRTFLNQAYTYTQKMRDIYENSTTLTAAQKQNYIFNLEHLEVQIDYMKYRNYDTVFETNAQKKYEFMKGFFDKCVRLDIKRLEEGGEYISSIRKTLGY